MSQTDRATGLAAGSAFKVACKAATTANITLSGEQTIDGVACTTGDRVLVKEQTDGRENGIYIVDTGSWSRAPDWDGVHDVRKGTITYVHSGSTNNGFWYVSTSDTITVGTTSVTLARASTVLAAITAFVQTLIDDADADSFVQTLVAALTAETTPAADDVVVLGDTSESKGNKMTLQNMLKVINSLTEETSPDNTNDFVLLYDASSGTAKKLKAQVQLGRMQRTEVSNSASGVTVSTGTNIVTLNCGTVNAGDRILVSGLATFVKGGSSGSSSVWVAKDSGTASITTYVLNTLLVGSNIDQTNGTTRDLPVSGIIKVAGSGTLTLALRGTSAGSNATASGEILAIVLNNG